MSRRIGIDFKNTGTGELTTMYVIDQKKCTFCAGCSAVCPQRAIVVYDDESGITAACVKCGLCECFCPVSAIYIQ